MIFSCWYQCTLSSIQCINTADSVTGRVSGLQNLLLLSANDSLSRDPEQ